MQHQDLMVTRWFVVAFAIFWKMVDVSEGFKLNGHVPVLPRPTSNALLALVETNHDIVLTTLPTSYQTHASQSTDPVRSEISEYPSGWDFSVMVYTNRNDIAYVAFHLDGSFVRTEKTAPYALFGDSNGHFFDGNLWPDQSTKERLVEASLFHHDGGVEKLSTLLAFGAPSQANEGSSTGGGGEGASPQCEWKDLRWEVIGEAPTPYENIERMIVSYQSKIYLFGGMTGDFFMASNKCHEYDPAKETWRELPDIPISASHIAEAVDEESGDVYALGGYEGKHSAGSTDRCFRYNILSEKWIELPSLPKKLGSGGAFILNGYIYFIGGAVRTPLKRDAKDSNKIFRLHLTKPGSLWEELDIVTPAYITTNHRGYTVYRDELYILGGHKGEDERHTCTSSFVKFDGEKFTALQPFPYPIGHTSLVVWSGMMFTTGGVTNVDYEPTNSRARKDTHYYDVEKDVWTELPNLQLPEQLIEPGLVTSGNDLYVLAGRVNQENYGYSNVLKVFCK